MKRIKGAIIFYKPEGLPTVVSNGRENKSEIMRECSLARGVGVQGKNMLVWRSRSLA